jgi:hypothetical protein
MEGGDLQEKGRVVKPYHHQSQSEETQDRHDPASETRWMEAARQEPSHQEEKKRVSTSFLEEGISTQWRK